MISKRFSAVLILVFVGAPSLGFVLVTGVFNARYAARLDSSAVWIIGSILVTVFLAGLPLAIELLREQNTRLANITQSLWTATIAFSAVAAMTFVFGSTSHDPQYEFNRLVRVLAATPAHRQASTIKADILDIQYSVGLNCSWRWLPVSARTKEACAPIFDLKRELAAAQEAEHIEARVEQLRTQLNVSKSRDTLTTIGSSALTINTWRKLLLAFIAGLIEFAAAIGINVTVRTVLAVLREDEIQEPTRIPETVDEQQLSEVDANTGWAMWFQTCISPQSNSRIKAREAFEHYQAWASLNGIKEQLHYTMFGKLMSSGVSGIGGKILHSNGRHYACVSLVQLGDTGTVIMEVA